MFALLKLYFMLSMLFVLSCVRAVAKVFHDVKTFAVSMFVAALASFTAVAHAAGPDLSTVTAAVDFGTVTTAVLGVAAALIVVYIAWKGAKMVIAAVRGG